MTVGSQATRLAPAFARVEAVSPDGAAAVFADGSGASLYVFATKAKTPISSNYYPGFTPDSRFLYQVSGPYPMQSLSLVPVGGGSDIDLVSPFTGIPTASPDVDHVAYVDETQALRTVDVTTKEKKNIAASASVVTGWVQHAFSPDGSRLWYVTPATGGQPSMLAVSTVDGSDKTALLPLPVDVRWAGSKLIGVRADGGGVYPFQQGVYLLTP